MTNEYRLVTDESDTIQVPRELFHNMWCKLNMWFENVEDWEKEFLIGDNTGELDITYEILQDVAKFWNEVEK